MSFLKNMFNPPYPHQNREEVRKLIEELIKIGDADDFLSELPGGRFNRQCRHIRAREIGERLDELGGFELMEMACHQVRKKLSRQLADHLEYAWAGIGRWMN
ncbi:MAG: hypothetical protein JW750_06625 [Anaerolineaceae bacterium]|nr:hypothetical protein [Anaerolineaceae bacterium]